MVLIVFSFIQSVSTAVTTVVLLQNCTDFRSGELGSCAASSEVGNEVVRMQVEGVTKVTVGEDHEPMTSSLTDAGVGFISVDCVARFIAI
jgi:hypothetical protein